MVESSENQSQQKPQDPHPQKSGIHEVKDEKMLAVIDKVIDKLVRVTVSDGRIYLGKLMCVDQTKTVFLQDCLELIDKTDEHYIEHELLTPHILNRSDPNQ